jgi:predicted RNA-binding protein with PIN domain
MPYLIDGHNLIGKLPDLSLDDPNDEALLVQRLAGFVARTNKKVVVIFDHGLPGGSSRMSTSKVEVVFATNGSNADEVIKRRIRNQKNPNMWTVVSSDNDVLFTARSMRMKAMTSAEFVQVMRRPARIKPGLDEAEHVQLSDDEVQEWMRLFGYEDE